MDNVIVRLLDLPTTIRSFVMPSEDDTYTVVINSKLNNIQQSEAYHHEIFHIKNRDLEKDELESLEFVAHFHRE